MPSHSSTHPQQALETRLPIQHTYAQILKSSMIIGGSSIVNIALGIIRTKAMAVLLGPSGVGLMGLFGSIADLTQTLAGMGINSSGVRQIAESAGSGETERIARTAIVLRRIAALLGLFGATLLVAFSKPVSSITFGTDQHAGAVALLAIAVFFTSVSGGNVALIQGLRRIPDLARISIFGAVFSTASSIPVIYFLRENGIVPSLISIAAMSMLTSWWYSRKVEIQSILMAVSQVRTEAAALLKLGLAFMGSGLLSMGSAYVVRMIIVRTTGLQAAGIYQSAWTVGGLYVAFILQSMGADFYPRLTAVSRDNNLCNRLVNEQAQISLLLAGPGVIATLTFAPLVIALFYSAKFAAAVNLLRWICLGMTLRVISWPMGFILLAKGEQQLFFWTEVAATFVHVGLAWLCIAQFSLDGAGMAFFGLCLFHALVIYSIVHRLTGFNWFEANRKIGRIFIFLIGLIFFAFSMFPFWLASAIGSLAMLIGCIYSGRILIALLPANRMPRLIKVVLSWLRLQCPG